MAHLAAQEIGGARVYGIPQMSYTIDGAAGKDFAAAVAMATLMQANAFELECNAITAMVRQRMTKLDELGEALATISAVMTLFPTKNPQSKDTVQHNGLDNMKTIMNRYGLSVTLGKNDNNQTIIRRDNANYAQNDVQYAIDREDNDLQQDMVSIQNMFSKRDNAFSSASRLVSKVYNASQSIIGNFGG